VANRCLSVRKGVGSERTGCHRPRSGLDNRPYMPN
jgi:hypothetical protein